MPPLDAVSGAPPIYLCTLEQLALPASILKKLGYELMSGEAPRLNELWAAAARLIRKHWAAAIGKWVAMFRCS